MFYDITLRISYSFGNNLASGRQLLRVMPKDLPRRQRVIAATLTFEPRPNERADGVDFFGNSTVMAAYRSVRREIGFSVQARVRRTAVAPGLDLSPDLGQLAGDIAQYQRLDGQSPHHFSGRSPRITPDSAVSAFASRHCKPGMTVYESALSLNQAIHKEMRFDAEATDVNTPASVAFRARRGVCQDFAHIMITALRSVGIPAGYVSGFLRTRAPKGKPRLEGADAMHAWVTVWCGHDPGWIEFDPTNGVVVANDHIVVATGRDYSDVTPVAGVLKTAGLQETEQAVDVVPLDRM